MNDALKANRGSRHASASGCSRFELFFVFLEDTNLLPPEFQERAQEGAARSIADYVAGMTDRYAIKEYQRIFTVDIS